MSQIITRGISSQGLEFIETFERLGIKGFRGGMFLAMLQALKPNNIAQTVENRALQGYTAGYRNAIYMAVGNFLIYKTLGTGVGQLTANIADIRKVKEQPKIILSLRLLIYRIFPKLETFTQSYENFKLKLVYQIGKEDGKEIIIPTELLSFILEFISPLASIARVSEFAQA